MVDRIKLGSMEPESDPGCFVYSVSPQANLAFRENFATICKYLDRRQVQELQLVERVWYDVYVPKVFELCKV